MQTELITIATGGTGEQCPRCGATIAGKRYYNIARRRLCVRCHDQIFYHPYPSPAKPSWFARVWQRIRGKQPA